LMIDHLLERMNRDSDTPKPRIERNALQALFQHTYPGNVRELENILERACALCDDALIEVGDRGLNGNVPQTTQTQELAGDLESHLAGVERSLIEQALQDNGWNRTAAAKELGLTLRSLRYRMEKLGLEQHEPGSASDGEK